MTTTANSVSKDTLYMDDLRVGQRFVSGEYQMTEERIKTFAAEFDPQPFHLDDAAAKKSLFGGLAASGWHTAAAAMKLLVGALPLSGGIIGMGGEIAWPRPTRPGDVLHIESEIVEIIPSRSKPNQGIARVRSVLLNQRGEEVQVLTAKLLVFKRPDA